MRFVKLALAIVLGALPVRAFAQTPAPFTEPALQVPGTGTVERSADQGRVNVTIVTNDDNAARSAGKNTDIYNALKTRVATLGVRGDGVRTTFYNVNFVPPAPKNLPPEQRAQRYGYVTTRNLGIVVTPLENVGKVVDAATASGATDIGNVSFELKDPHAAYVAALGAAMADAKRTAATLESAGGFRIVRIRRIEVGNDFQPRPFENQLLRAAPAAAAAPPPTEIGPNGPIVTTARVTVTYDIR